MKKLTPFQKNSLKIFFIGMIAFIAALILIFISIETNFLSKFYYHMLHGLSADIGIVAAVLLGLALALWAIRLIIRQLNPRTLGSVWAFANKKNIKLSTGIQEKLSEALIGFIKPILIPLSKLFRAVHIPLALIGLVIISFHVYIFIALGFKFTIGYILGAAAAIILAIIVISGFLRIFNKGIKSHKFLGILFIILTLLHVIFI